MRRGIELNEQEIDREIADIDNKLKELQALQQRRSDLYNIKLLAQRLWGDPKPSGGANGNGAHSMPSVPANSTNAGVAFHVLSSHPNPLSLDELMVGMRTAGWKCSGDDEIDKKRVYAAIYKKPGFARTPENKWRTSP
jgi:hypothetical protein